MSMQSTTCQQCHQPLLIDPSISNLTPSSYSLISGSLPESSNASRVKPTPAPVPPPHASGSGSGSSSSNVPRRSQFPPSSRESAEIWARYPSNRGVAESFVLLNDSIYPASGPNGAGSGYDQSVSGPSNYSHLHSQSHSQSHDRPHTQQSRPAIPNHELAANLHHLISSKTGVSHPLCVECIGILQVELQKELDELSRERDAYIQFEQGILRREVSASASGAGGGGLGEYDIEGTPDEWEALLKKKKELEVEEVKLIHVLRAKEKELEGVKVEEENVKREEKQVEREEEEFLRNHASLSTQLRHLTDELESAKMHLLASTSLLAHLESTNVYNDAFQIGYTPLNPVGTMGGLGGAGSGAGAAGVGGIASASSFVGTINGLRLGGRPIVEWDEINAAWGHVALCVDRIAARVGFVFDKYKIYPLGSFSKIDELPPSKQSYELFASPEISGFLHNRRFSHGLVALLDCIRQLVEFGQRGSRGWPVGSVEIKKDRISGYSIRLPGLVSAMPALPMSIMGLGGSTSASSGAALSGQQHQQYGRGQGNEGDAAISDTRGGKRDKVDKDMSGEEQWTKACLAVLKVLKQILIAESEAEKAVQ